MDDPDWNDKPLDWLIGYTPGMALPTPRDRFDRAWAPERAYFRRNNEDAHWAWVNGNRAFTKSRWIREYEDRALINEIRLELAGERLRRLIASGAIDMTEIPADDLARAETAMTYALAVIGDHKVDAKTRLSASRMVLDFCRAKPATNTNVTVNAAEALLAAIDDDQ